MPLPIMALMSAAGPMMQGVASLMEASKGAPPPSGAGMAGQGDNTGFGENTSLAALKAGGANANRPFAPPPPPPFQGTTMAGSEAQAAQMPVPGLSATAPPIPQPQQPKPAETYSQGVEAPNIAPPVGGETGGAGSTPLTQGSTSNPNPVNTDVLTSTGPEGGYKALNAEQPMLPEPGAIPPIAPDTRLQDFMGVAGPAAGLLGAGIGAATNAQGRPPASGGFPARGGGWNMPPSLAVASQYNRRR